ncbi:MAG: DegT/DnrJ/EryC1/StrS family aminotransferase [Vampirovibrionales bacterium]|nr:DegT/DnrJ/EryC1/StrS family aminotransferase [Vampirovibrionales bacterium]
MAEIRAEVDATIARALDATAFIGGDAVSSFEAAFAEYCGVARCVGVGNGTDALLAIFRALGVRPGDEVIAPAMSFIATLEPLMLLGARPVLADIDPVTMTLDPSQAAARLTSRTRALLPVHLYGQPADMTPLAALSEQHGLALIEDAAQAHGALYQGRRVGALGMAAAFSFYPGKNLGACGDGGAVTTQDPALAEAMARFCDHGRLTKYEHALAGVNSRLDALQAGILSIKLARLDGWNQRRQQWAERYRLLLEDVAEIALPQTREDRTHAYHQYVLRTDRRDDLARFLAQRGISTGLHYPLPLHLQPACAALGYAPGDFPHAESLATTCLSLPMFAELTEAEVDAVAQGVRAFFGYAAR